MRLCEGWPAYDLPIFRETTEHLISKALGYFKSSDWRQTLTDNETRHPNLRLPRNLSPELIAELAAIVTGLGDQHFRFVAASQKLVETEANLVTLSEELKAIETASNACRDLFKMIGPPAQLFLGTERSLQLEQSIQTIKRESNSAIDLVSLPQAKGFTVPAARGLGLDDTGIIFVTCISRFQSLYPDLRQTAFACGCAWDLVRVKNKKRNTPDWESFSRQYRRWAAHPLAADIEAEKQPAKYFPMSAAATGN